MKPRFQCTNCGQVVKEIDMDRIDAGDPWGMITYFADILANEKEVTCDTCRTHEHVRLIKEEE